MTRQRVSLAMKKTPDYAGKTRDPRNPQTEQEKRVDKEAKNGPAEDEKDEA